MSSSVPVIALAGTGPIATLKRSAGLFGSRWGQQVTGNVAIGGGRNAPPTATPGAI